MSITIRFQLSESFFRTQSLQAAGFHAVHDDAGCPGLADFDAGKCFRYLVVDGVYCLGPRIFVCSSEMDDKYGSLFAFFQRTE